MSTLLGRQTRPHGDLDVAVQAEHVDALVQVLSAAGFAAVGEHGATARNYLLARPDGPVLDLHVIRLDNGLLGPVEAGSVYRAAALTGRGRIGDRDVDCISAQWAVYFHDAYTGDANDRADVHALCAQFGLELPAQYR